MAVSNLVIEVRGKPIGHRLAGAVYQTCRFVGMSHSQASRIALWFMVVRLKVGGKRSWCWLGRV